MACNLYCVAYLTLHRAPVVPAAGAEAEQALAAAHREARLLQRRAARAENAQDHGSLKALGAAAEDLAKAQAAQTAGLGRRGGTAGVSLARQGQVTTQTAEDGADALLFGSGAWPSLTGTLRRRADAAAAGVCDREGRAGGSQRRWLFRRRSARGLGGGHARRQRQPRSRSLGPTHPRGAAAATAAMRSVPTTGKAAKSMGVVTARRRVELHSGAQPGRPRARVEAVTRLRV